MAAAKVKLLDEHGRPHNYYLMRPGVYIPESDPDPESTLRRLFPREFQPAAAETEEPAKGATDAT